jgi:hypothetical protein
MLSLMLSVTYAESHISVLSVITLNVVMLIVVAPSAKVNSLIVQVSLTFFGYISNLSINITIGCKSLTTTNALAYFS